MKQYLTKGHVANQKKLIIYSFLLCIFLISIQSASAQQTKELSLNEAIKLSLSNSHKLAASAARIQEVTAQLEETKDSRLPDASVSGSALWLGNPDLSLKTGKPGSDSSRGFPSVHTAAYGLVNVSLPLFAGGKIKYGIASAKFLERAALLQSSHDTADIILNTIEAYTNLYKASVTVNVVKQNLLQAMHRDSVFLRLENNGLLARNDRLKAQLQSSNMKVSLLEAQSNATLATTNMDIMLGLPENTILIPDSSSFDLHESPEALMDLEQYSLTSRKDILALHERENAAQSGILVAKSAFFPTIALTGGYVAAYIPKVLTLTNAINAGIGIHYNISSLWKTKSKIAEATAKVAEIRANELQLQDAVKLQLYQAFEDFTLRQKKLNVYEAAIGQAEENYRITKNKFDNALVNTQELLDANLLLLQSRINLAVAKADLFLSYKKLQQTAGKLSQ